MNIKKFGEFHGIKGRELEGKQNKTGRGKGT
jgi:hypothetical protein